MHQSTTPSLSQTIWPRWASRQFLSLPIVQTLLPVTFDYSLSSRKNCRIETIERGCDEGHWHGHTRGLPWGLPEVIGMVQVHCRRLLQRGLEFHGYTSNKSAHTKKSGNLLKAPHISQIKILIECFRDFISTINYKEMLKFCNEDSTQILIKTLETLKLKI